MFYVEAISMKTGFNDSDNYEDIKLLYVRNESGGCWKTKETVHDEIKYYAQVYRVNNNPYPVLVPCENYNGEKFVKSSPNEYRRDNLLSLPRY